MLDQSLLDRVTVDPEVMVGKPTIRGLRITIEQILASLASGITIEELLADFPDLEFQYIQAALLYATRLVGHERVYAIGVGATP